MDLLLALSGSLIFFLYFATLSLSFFTCKWSQSNCNYFPEVGTVYEIMITAKHILFAAKIIPVVLMNPLH